MWPIGPDPFVSTDMHEFYRSLASAEEGVPSTTSSAASRGSAASSTPCEPVGHDPLWQLVRYMAWTILGPSVALTTICILLLDGVAGVDWRFALLATSLLIWVAPYARILAARRSESSSTADNSMSVGTWETGWR